MTLLDQARSWFTSPENVVARSRPATRWGLEAFLRAYPDDAAGVMQFTRSSLGRVHLLLMPGPEAMAPPVEFAIHPRQEQVEAMFSHLFAFLGSLKPVTPAGKDGIQKALAEAANNQKPLVQARLFRLSRAELEARLRANPDDLNVMDMYVLKSHREIAMTTSRAECGKKLAAWKVFFERLRFASAEARKKKEETLRQITYTEDRFETDRRGRKAFRYLHPGSQGSSGQGRAPGPPADRVDTGQPERPADDRDGEETGQPHRPTGRPFEH
jgi:hypothetical protein